MFRKALSIVLAMLLLGTMGACGSTQQTETTEDESTSAQEVPTKGFLKVLTLGHSLTVDSCHMLALVAKAEGYEGLHVGTLYDSGTPLSRHVDYLQRDAKGYSLYYSNTEDVSGPPLVMDEVTMREALRYQAWDLIVMQGGTFDLAAKTTFMDGNIQIIQKYVNEHKLNPNAVFAWHMPWAFATEQSLQNTFPRPDNNPYPKGYAAFGNDRLKLYEAIAKNVKEYILTDDTFQFLIPTGTAIENAMSSYLTEFDLIRDYAHATDYGRLIAAYTWYCRLAGIEQLEDIQLTTIPKRFFKSTVGTEDRVLTDMEKAILIESVNNALKTQLEVTQSQYTEAPTQ